MLLVFIRLKFMMIMNMNKKLIGYLIKVALYALGLLSGVVGSDALS